MGLFDRKRTEPAGEGSSWTAGRELGGRVISVVLLAAIACGPVALLWQGTRPESVIAAPESSPSALPAEQQAAGDFALAYVAAWLGASRDDRSELERFVDVSALGRISDTAWEYRDLAIASLEPGESDLVSVVVAANVRELVTDDEGGSSDQWPRRYFQVVVNVGDDGALGVVGLPAPVAAPVAADVVTLGYRTSVPSNDPVADSVLAFLNAYLAGSGDITRVSTPGTSFQALTPAPYAAIDLVDLRADAATEGTPGNGDTLRVLATAGLTNVYDQRLTATYALTLIARDDRWEISAIDPVPLEGASTTTQPTPTPTGDGTN